MSIFLFANNDRDLSESKVEFEKEESSNKYTKVANEEAGSSVI